MEAKIPKVQAAQGARHVVSRKGAESEAELEGVSCSCKCHEKNILRAYHKLCKACGEDKGVCCKCTGPLDGGAPAAPVETPEGVPKGGFAARRKALKEAQAELDELYASNCGLPERRRRTRIRELERFLGVHAGSGASATATAAADEDGGGIDDDNAGDDDDDAAEEVVDEAGGPPDYADEKVTIEALDVDVEGVTIDPAFL
jgi:hypothetical protein